MEIQLLFGLLCVWLPYGNAIFDIDKCIPDLGCFDYVGDFYHPIYRPFALLPSDREKINTTFRLYTKSNPTTPIYLNNSDPNYNFTSTPFNAEDETKIIIHGFREGESAWMTDVKDEVLKRISANIITVDWNGGSGLPYTLAATNTRVVGAEVGFLIEKLVSQVSANLDRFHIIGFSLGAHTAGYAGQRLQGQIRRITALDPAGPMFEGMGTKVRLDPSDAKFVDAVHTDAKTLLQLSFGTSQTMGHIDFYPNGGHDQPGCPQSDPEKFKVITIDLVVKGLDTAGDEVACRHRRAYYLFLDTLKNDAKEIGFPCKNEDKFNDGQCGTCGRDGELCGVIGLEGESLKPITTPEGGVKLFLKTSEEEPYKKYHYQITLSTPKDDSSRGRGINIFIKTVSFGGVNATLEGENGEKESVQLTSGNQLFEASTDYRFLAISSKDLGILKSISVTFTKSGSFENIVRLNWRVRDELSLKNIKAVAMDRLKILKKSEEISTYCSENSKLQSGNDYQFLLGGSC